MYLDFIIKKQRLARDIFFLSLLFLLSGCSKPRTDIYDRFYFRHNNADLAVEVNGNIASNTFILLLHGGPGGGSYLYNTGLAADLLEEKFAVVYLDQRGHGASKGNFEAEDLTFQSNSEDIHALVQLLKKRYGEENKLFLMGHSWGGQTGTHALLNTEVQSELAGWIEVGGAHDLPMLNVELVKMFINIGEQEIEAGRNVGEWQRRVDYARSLDTFNISNDEAGELNVLAQEAEDLIDQVAAPDETLSLSHGLLGIPVLSLASFFSNQFAYTILEEEALETALTDRMHEIRIPSLLLWGKYDFVVPPALGYSADKVIPNSKLIIFEKSGHSPMVNEPREFSEAIISFIESN